MTSATVACYLRWRVISGLPSNTKSRPPLKSAFTLICWSIVIVVKEIYKLSLIFLQIRHYFAILGRVRLLDHLELLLLHLLSVCGHILLHPQLAGQKVIFLQFWHVLPFCFGDFQYFLCQVFLVWSFVFPAENVVFVDPFGTGPKIHD